jgi:hypothetical protein
MELDAFVVRAQPSFAGVIEPVARAVVDDHEHLPRRVLAHDVLEKAVEGVTVEDVREEVAKVDLLHRDRTVYVCRLALAEGIDTRLVSDARPGLVQRAIEPETGLVLKDYDSAARSGFFLIAGSRTRSQWACASASARAKRFRGRCTEKPS